MEQPLVTVICLCYNHEQFVQEAVESVLNQTYPNVQLILVDDASTDGSVEVIKSIKTKHTTIEVLLLDRNVGNCTAFNKGLALAKGEYVIDLAADDILLTKRIKIGVDRLTTLGETYGVHYSDALLINESGAEIQKHSEKVKTSLMPTGNIYEAVISRYFICSPTMMIRKKVLDELGGYDESLHYEDFDFWIRSSRNYLYDYTDEVLVNKRILKGSLFDVQFKRSSDHWKSTLCVLEKVKELNKIPSEDKALRIRLWYEVGYHLKRFSFGAVYQYLRLLILGLFQNIAIRINNSINEDFEIVTAKSSTEILNSADNVIRNYDWFVKSKPPVITNNQIIIHRIASTFAPLRGIGIIKMTLTQNTKSTTIRCDVQPYCNSYPYIFAFGLISMVLFTLAGLIISSTKDTILLLVFVWISSFLLTLMSVLVNKIKLRHYTKALIKKMIG